MTMRNKNENTQFTTEFTSSSVLDQKSFDVTGTLTWSPVIVNNGDTICCDVTHTTTLGSTPQTVCRQITVAHEDEDNIINYVVIGILAVLVLFVLLVVIIPYRRGREKKKDNTKSKHVSEQTAMSNRQDNAGKRNKFQISATLHLFAICHQSETRHTKGHYLILIMHGH
ncbi:uncharacterized protein [Mytilus edulis]|uniref:uncharacterized protein n=1 Tax=Mytilus edulis TaxID=6550 RepID=UPI0039EFEC45